MADLNAPLVNGATARRSDTAKRPVLKKRRPVQPGKENLDKSPVEEPMKSSERGGSNHGFFGRASTQPSAFTHRSSARMSYAHESPAQLKEFLTSALGDVEFSEASRHHVVNYLATEDGLARVCRIVETEFSPRYSVTKPMFDPHCLLFLRLITHNDVLRSLAVEKAVGTIYNVIFGLNGNRAAAFFQNVVDCLKNEHDKEESALHYLESRLLIAKALLRVLVVNQEAPIKAELKVAAQSLFAQVLNDSPASDSANIQLRELYDTLQSMSDILAMGDSVPVANLEKTSTSKPHQPAAVEVTSPVDLPGDRSESGPRHDNDHELIAKIQILPTLSEINSQRQEFLPARDTSSLPGVHHQQGILRLLDSQFRLLREDTSGLLRDAVRMSVKHWNTIIDNTNWATKRILIRRESPTPLRFYYGARIRHLLGGAIQGLQLEVEFDQPYRIRKLDPLRRKRHYINSRSLREGGGLLALIDAKDENDVNVAFLQVSKRQIEPFQRGQSGPVSDLVNDDERAMITLRLPGTPTANDLSSLLSMQTKQQHEPERLIMLVEFPVILYNQFEGILRCLQTMHNNPSDIPFTRWLTAGTRNSSTDFSPAITSIPPPRYLEGATLDLSAILESNDGTLGESNPSLRLSTQDSPQTLYQKLCSLSSLDTGQAEAMISALTHEVALIQGPPGTGKSYVGIQIAKCLISNKERLGLGPLLCVCYTNHALDQFLTELFNTGVTRIVRIGSRSPSGLMEDLSLDNYKRRGAIPKLLGLGKKISESKSRLITLGAEIEAICQEFRAGPLAIAGGFMRLHSAEYGHRIREGRPDLEAMKTWIDGNGPGDWHSNAERSIKQLFSVGPMTLTHAERLRMFRYCYGRGIEDRVLRLQGLLQAQAAEKSHHTFLFTQSDAQLFDQMDVIGVTTTGLVNNSDLLRTVKAKVLICEEAGEVLESHTLTAMLPSIQHAILIGDHLQLRPKISRLSLSMDYDTNGPKYSLNESLFERLANTKFTFPGLDGEEPTKFKFPVAQLDHQRRMHPCISSLIRSTLYPKLKDHSDTMGYPEIAGMRRRLFWLDHRNSEDPGDPDDPLQSKTNTWEAEMVTALVSHLCHQGVYRPGEIAVLAPYVSQLRLLEEMLENTVSLVIGEDDAVDLDMEDEVDQNTVLRRNRTIHKGSLSGQVRMATIDNFQGEEATVVIISLVRSNAFRNCGFLKTPNRINVLLSRAKHGMYIIGNAETSCRVPMWGSVIGMLEKSFNIGPELELQCRRHPDNKSSVSCPDDFAKVSPEGGCSDQCGLRLRCGHTCTFKCHPFKMHNAVKCMDQCIILRECGHVCRRKCHEQCGDCPEVIPGVLLPCGHPAQVRCQDIGNLGALECTHIVAKKLPICGHQFMAQCFQEKATIKCPRLCGSPLSCGHGCQNECWSCRRFEIPKHGKCMASCGRQFTTCPHSCTRACHDGSECPPCRLSCEVRCVHNKCPNRCCDPCPPCAERCGWRCTHRDHSCDLPCAVPCSIVPCNKRCDKFLGCGHRCPGACGEKCPEAQFCQQCGKPDVLNQQVDFILALKYSEIDVDEDPVIFLSCGHFCTRSTFDGMMGLQEFYEIDPYSETILRPKTAWRKATTAPGCPFCRRSLRDIHRYNRIVKKALLDESTKRFVLKTQRCLVGVHKALDRHEEELENETGRFIASWRATNTTGQLGSDQMCAAVVAFEMKDKTVQRQVNNFIKNSSKIEQPLSRVNALLASAVARSKSIHGDPMPIEEQAIFTSFHFQGLCLDLRLSWAVQWANERVYADATVNPDIRSMVCGKTRNQLPHLLEKCRTVRERSIEEHFPAEKVQATVYYALFSRVSLSLNASLAGKSLSEPEIWLSLAECEALCKSDPTRLAHLQRDIEKAKRYCAGGTFHSTVSPEEKRQVYEAMAAQFSGTGHWYYCRNNHPFTVGECGMPTEEARCPQCGEAVGGIDHRPLPGVRRAEDFEAEVVEA